MGPNLKTMPTKNTLATAQMGVQIMNNIAKISTFKVPLSFDAHDVARQCSSNSDRPDKTQQVYMNTLAVYAVDYYLRLMGFKTDWPHSESRDPIALRVLDVADLEIPDIGKLECRPVLADAEFCELPLEVQEDRVGYAVVRIDPSLKEGEILGFTPTAASTIALQQLQSVDALLEMLTKLEQAAALSEQGAGVTQLGRWLKNQVETGWEQLETLLGGEPQLEWSLLGTPSVSEIERGKLVNLDMQLQKHPLVFIAAITPEENDKVGVHLKIRTGKGQSFLPPNLELSLLDETGETLQSVVARQQDTLIQLPRFRGDSGEKFQVQIHLADSSFTEAFVL